jgi:hypothetical protein
MVVCFVNSELTIERYDWLQHSDVILLSLENTSKPISNKLENLQRMDSFLDEFDQPKLNWEDINHLHRSVTGSEIEAVMSLPTKKAQDPVDSLLISPDL